MNKKKHFNQPTALVVFGATGDLTQNKLYPSLYELSKRKLLPKWFTLYGLARQDLTEAQFKKDIRSDINSYTNNKSDKQALDNLLAKVVYIRSNIRKREAFDLLEVDIKKRQKKLGKAILRIFYLALPPTLFADVIKNVETCKMGKDLCTVTKVHSRIIVEKPFGYDLKTAQKLDKMIRGTFNERQIYRIDHYLGKEAFQMLFAFRFANGFFEDHWNAQHISEIQINGLEPFGTEGRYSYYDGAGAIRDMIQSHLLQFLAYITMDEPADLSASALRQAKEKILKNVRPSRKNPNMIRGQYKGYHSEPGIPKNSKTATFAALKFKIDTPRWKGIPIYIRTGKYMSKKDTSAIITFKHRAPLFMKNKSAAEVLPNRLVLQISPSPSITMQMNVNEAGFGLGTIPTQLHYCRHESNSQKPIGDYERLLMEAIEGEQLLFTSSVEVLSSWRAVQPFLDSFEKSKPIIYPQNTDGPKQSEKLFSKSKSEWLSIPSGCDIHS